MKEGTCGRSVRAGALLGALACVVASVPATGVAQTATPLTVREAAIGTRVDRETRTVVGPGTAFPATVGQLACLTRIAGGTADTQIVHVWKQGDTERARVILPVHGANWRTWSTKRILPTWTGDWSVEVQAPDGRLIERIPFRVEPASGTPPRTPGASPDSGDAGLVPDHDTE